jgi:hypothetical protein
MVKDEHTIKEKSPTSKCEKKLLSKKHKIKEESPTSKCEKKLLAKNTKPKKSHLQVNAVVAKQLAMQASRVSNLRTF